MVSDGKQGSVHEHQQSAPSATMNLKSPRDALRPERPPEPPKRSRHRKNPFVIVLNFFFSLAVIGLIAGLGLFFWGSQEYIEAGPLEKARKVVVAKGANLSTISRNLARAKVISSPLIFQASVFLQRKEGDMKAGEYLFDKGVAMREVVNKLVEGKALIYKVTLPEGLTSLAIVSVLRKNKVLVGDLDVIPPEGSMLPDTYTFGRGATRKQIVERMTRAQDVALKRIWSRRIDGLPVKTPRELVVLASIVEKETGKADERSRVAGVFINRLNRGIRLQSDPTIIYGLFGGAGKPKGRPIYKSDIAKKTPYNTYTIDALPPGPIANPGMAAMEAVANPSVTKDIYFVADGTGGHVFAETLDEHNNNVRRWRQIEAERKLAAKKKKKAAASE